MQHPITTLFFTPLVILVILHRLHLVSIQFIYFIYYFLLKGWGWGIELSKRACAHPRWQLQKLNDLLWRRYRHVITLFCREHNGLSTDDETGLFFLLLSFFGWGMNFLVRWSWVDKQNKWNITLLPCLLVYSCYSSILVTHQVQFRKIDFSVLIRWY